MDLNPCIPSCWSFDGEKSSKQHEKGLDLYQSFRNYYAAWPLQRAAVCIVTNHRLQPLQGKCRKSTPGMCHYTFVSTCILFSVSVSCSCPSRHKSTDSSLGTSSSGVKRGTCKWCRGQKKEHSALASVVVDTLAKSTKWYAASPAGKTEHTHTHPHTHTHTQTHTKYLE